MLSTASRVPKFDEQRPEDLETSPAIKTTSGTADGVPVTDVDSELSSPRSETLQATAPAEKPTPKISYDTVEGELRTTTSETENQETSDDGRTITRRVKTSSYYQPVIHRTLADGVVVTETSEEVLVGSYVDEYCFDAPLDVVDLYSASVETQTSVDETEQTLDDGTWLRRKVTRVVAYLAVDEEETEGVRDAGAEPKLAADRNPPADSKHADHPDHETGSGTEPQRSTADGGLESKEFVPGAVERTSKQVIVESVEKPVDTGSQLEREHVQHAQLESASHSVPSTEQSTDSRDLTCKIEPSSVVAEAEPEHEIDHAVVISRDEQITAEAVAPSERSTTTEPKEASSVPSAESPEELMPMTEELIMAAPSARQDRARPTIIAADMTSSFDEPEEFPAGEQLIEEQQTVEQFAAPFYDLEPVSEETITPNLRPSKESATLDTAKLDSITEETTTAPGCVHESKKTEPTEEYCAVPPATVTRTDDSVSKETQDSAAPVSEELIIAVPNPRQERSRPVMAPVPITSSFDETEELIEECPAVEQFAAPVCDFKPVEEDVIAASIRRPRESVKDVATAKPDSIQGESTPETSQQQDLAKPASDTTTVEQVPDSMKTASDSKGSTTEAMPVTEELIIAVPNARQESLPRSNIATVPITSSFDEPEELLPDEQLIEEQQTAEQFAAPACDLKPAEEDLIAADIRPPRPSRDTAILDNGIAVPETVDRTPFVPVEKIKSTSETVQPSSTDSKVDQPRTRPVLVLKSDSDTKTRPGASTFVPTLPPITSSRQPRRPRSANETLSRRYGIESPQPGVYSKPHMRRESPLSFVDRFAYPGSPTPLGVEDFDSPLFDDGCRQVRTRSKKLITHKVRKVRRDGEVVEDIVTEEVPDYGYSDTSSMRSEQSPAVMSPRTASVSSLTSPLPVEPASPGADSLSSQSSLRVFTDTVEREPEVVTDVQEREETLPDGRVVIRKIIRTRQKQTIVKRTVMEGPLADDEQPTEVSGQLVAAGEDIQKPDIRTYSDAMDMRPSTETVSNDVEEILPDGTVQRKLTTTTSTRQLKTERTVVEGPYVPETVSQALQGDVLRSDKTPMLPQSASPSSASRPASTTTKTSGSSRTSPRPKFRISMESPPPPTAAENVGAAPRKTTDSSHPTEHPRSQDDRS